MVEESDFFFATSGDAKRVCERDFQNETWIKAQIKISIVLYNNIILAYTNALKKFQKQIILLIFKQLFDFAYFGYIYL